MGLLPLEFTECLQDSPYFRDSLISHEKELERTSNNMKELIKEVKNLLSAARTLSSAQRRLSNTLLNFKFECIGNQQTDDEIIIAGSLKEFGRLISAIEDEKERMLDQAQQFIVPLENFRKEHIGAVKEGKKKFDKQTAKFCASQERYLGLSRKKQDTVLQDADATLEMEQRDFIRAGLEYVCLIQEVQERKKFEFVETLLGFMYGWLTFYHHGHEVAKDYKPHMTELQTRIQKTRENFDASRADIQALMRKMLEVRQSKYFDVGSLNKMYTRSGYLYQMERKHVIGTISWNRYYCQYRHDAMKEDRIFLMRQFNQTTAKIVSNETFRLKSCVRRISDSIDKRFCFDITPEDKPGVVYTFQALSEEDCELWLDAMDGKEPMYVHPPKPGNAHHTYLDEAGFTFVAKSFQTLESRGLEDQGLYRIVGVTSKVNRLLTQGLDKKKIEKLNFDDATEVESKTITSAVKTFLRNLPEPIMTYKLHSKFIAAAKLDTYEARVTEVKRLTEQLPEPNKRMLEILSRHLEKVALNSKKNMMTVSNLGVCFGPTLLRNEEETVAAIMDIKFGNLVVEIFVENWRQILAGGPPRKEPRLSQSMTRTSGSSLTVLPHSPSSVQHHDNTPNVQLSPAFNSAQHSIDMFMKMSGNLSPGRPPPPPYFPPPPPGSIQHGISPSSVIPNNNSSHKHINSSPSGILGSPHNYNSATWERPIHRGGTIGGVGSAVRPSSQVGGNQVTHNNMTSSMSKLTVPPPLGSAPVGSVPSQQHPQQYQNHRNVHATLSNSSAPLIRGSSSSSISTSQDPLTQFQTSPNNTHSGYNHSTTQLNRLNTQHLHGALQQGAVPPPPIKQRSFVLSRTNNGNTHDSSPQNPLSNTPSRQGGTHPGMSPYVNASAAETDLLNNSFGSDKGSHSGPLTAPKSTKFHHAPPRHAPKQPPPPAPTIQGSILFSQPPYIPPPQPRTSINNDNNMRKMSSEQLGKAEVLNNVYEQEQREHERSDVPDNNTHIERSRHRGRKTLQNITGSDTSSSMESLTSGGGSNYELQGMEIRDPRLSGKVNDGESSEPSSSRERINNRTRRRVSTESSPKERKNTLSTGTSDEEGKDNWGQNNDTQYGVRSDEDTTHIKDNKEESDPSSHVYGNLASHGEKGQRSGKGRKKSSTHSSAVRTAIQEVENTLASADALKTVSAAYGSPIIIPQTATVQPLQQLQLSNSVSTSKEMRTSVSSPSPSSSASSSAAPAQFNAGTSSSPAVNKTAGDTVRTLYACVGEHESELSFEPNQIIIGVRSSLEPGWLEGSLDGKFGLVPENYVEYIT